MGSPARRRIPISLRPRSRQAPLPGTLHLTDKMVAGPKNPTAGGGGLKGGPRKNAKVTKKFIVNATQPVNDRIFDASAFTTFLQQRIKVDSLTGILGERINVTNLGDAASRLSPTRSS